MNREERRKIQKETTHKKVIGHQNKYFWKTVKKRRAKKSN